MLRSGRCPPARWRRWRGTATARARHRWGAGGPPAGHAGHRLHQAGMHEPQRWAAAGELSGHALGLVQVEAKSQELRKLMAEAGLKPKGAVHCWQYGKCPQLACSFVCTRWECHGPLALLWHADGSAGRIPPAPSTLPLPHIPLLSPLLSLLQTRPSSGGCCAPTRCSSRWRARRRRRARRPARTAGRACGTAAPAGL